MEIKMPKFTDGMEQGEILTWLKQEGESYVDGDELCEVGTDKVTYAVEARNDGVLEKILVNEGETVAVGVPIAIVTEK